MAAAVAFGLAHSVERAEPAALQGIAFPGGQFQQRLLFHPENASVAVKPHPTLAVFQHGIDAVEAQAVAGGEIHKPAVLIHIQPFIVGGDPQPARRILIKGVDPFGADAVMGAETAETGGGKFDQPGVTGADPKIAVRFFQDRNNAGGFAGQRPVGGEAAAVIFHQKSRLSADPQSAGAAAAQCDDMIFRQAILPAEASDLAIPDKV